MPEPGQVSRWYSTLYPMAQQGGPLLTLLLAVLFAASMWYGLGMIQDCVERNRLLSERLVSQQEKFHTDILLRLAHCPPQGKE